MYVMGIDIGSLATKAVILNDRALITYAIVDSGAEHRRTVERVVDQTLAQAGLTRDQIGYIVATGYGRINVPFAHKQVTEISCHARGVNSIFPSVRTIIDVGGQDSKAIRVTGTGKVVDFQMNDKCAAGTGRFLEVIARALEVPLEEIGPLSLESTNRVKISSMCTVFAESEVVSRIAEGTSKIDILAGVHDAIAGRIRGLADRVKIERECAITGGGAKNVGLVRALEELLGFPMLRAEEPQITGALGAALIAHDSVQEVASAGSRAH
jgi:predicted CoA-substrate-specific enzyme activase